MENYAVRLSFYSVRFIDHNRLGCLVVFSTF